MTEEIHNELQRVAFNITPGSKFMRIIEAVKQGRVTVEGLDRYFILTETQKNYIRNSI